MNVLVIQGHPDAAHPHLCHALADAYIAGAEEAGHAVRTINVATLEFPWLMSQQEWAHGKVPEALDQAQEDILWADHLVFFYPLWLGDMPAILKAFLEQVARPGFAFDRADDDTLFAKKGLTGRSARVVVTMGMPALLYRWYFRAHSVKSLQRNILSFAGIAPVNQTLVGSVGKFRPVDAARWLKQLHHLGQHAC